MMKFRPGQCVQWTAHFLPNTVSQYGYVLYRYRCGTTSRVVVVTLDKRHYSFEEYEWWKLEPAKRPDATLVKESRGDYDHYGVVVGKRMVIVAGCRTFNRAASALKHWKRRERQAFNYRHPGVTPVLNLLNKPMYKTASAKRARAKDRRLDAWSRRFVRKIERLRQRG